MTFTIDKSTWKIHTFDQIAVNVNDRIDVPAESGLQRYVGLEHLTPGELRISRWADPTEAKAQKLHFLPGDVIFGRRRAYQRKVAQADFEGLCSAHALVLRAKPDVCIEEFLPHFIASDSFMECAIGISVGSTSPTVNWKDLRHQEFLLPTIEEQHRIADLLWQFEQTLESLSEAEQIVSNSRETAFESLIRELDVPLVDLRQLLSYSTVGVVVKPASLYTDSQDGVPALRGTDIRPGVIDTSQCVRFDREKEKDVSKSRLQLDDVVVVRSGRPGDAARISEENVGMNCIDLLLLRPSSVLLGEFLELCLNSTFCRKQTAILSGGSAQQHLNLRNIRSFKIPNVSLRQQNSMVESVARFKSLQAIIHQEILDTQGLKNSLMLQLHGGSDVC